MLLEELEVVQVQVVSGIEAQAHVVSRNSGLGERCNGTVGVGIKFLGKGAGVELDAVGAGACGGADGK